MPYSNGKLKRELNVSGNIKWNIVNELLVG